MKEKITVDSFKNWLSLNGDFFWEMTNLKTADTSNVHLEPTGTDFDRYDAEQDCRRSVERNFDYSSFYEDEGIYEFPEDDPEFTTPTVEKWEEDHPEPESSDYEDEEEFNSAHEEWQSEREQAETDYDKAVTKWEREKSRKEDRAQDAANDAMQEEIDNCVAEAESEYESQTKGFVHNFKHDGDDFEVHLDNDNVRFADQTIDNVYNVTFKGPEGYSSTGKAGTQATEIYSKLILAIKKLMDDHEVNGLQFTPAEPAMRIMYTRFYNSFMKDHFVRVQRDLYIKRDIVKNALEAAKSSGDEYMAKRILGSVVDAHRANKIEVDKAKTIKTERRSANRIGEELIGQFVPLYGDGSPYLVIGFDKGSSMFDLARPDTWMSFNAVRRRFENVALPFSKLKQADFQKDFPQMVSAFNYEDADSFPLYALAKTTNTYGFQKPDVSTFADKVKAIITEIRSWYNSPVNSTTIQTHKEYFHTTHPEAAKALEAYAKRIGVDLTAPKAPVVEPKQEPSASTVNQPAATTPSFSTGPMTPATHTFANIPEPATHSQSAWTPASQHLAGSQQRPYGTPPEIAQTAPVSVTQQSEPSPRNRKLQTT